jgi:hypothetical protein
MKFWLPKFSGLVNRLRTIPRWLYGLAEMQMTIPLKRWQVRQDSKNDFCGFRCVIQPIQKMFELESFFYINYY